MPLHARYEFLNKSHADAKQPLHQDAGELGRSCQAGLALPYLCVATPAVRTVLARRGVASGTVNHETRAMAQITIGTTAFRHDLGDFYGQCFQALSRSVTLVPYSTADR